MPQGRQLFAAVLKLIKWVEDHIVKKYIKKRHVNLILILSTSILKESNFFFFQPELRNNETPRIYSHANLSLNKLYILSVF